MSFVTSGDIAARLDRLPSSRTLWGILLLISLGGVFEFYDLFFTAYVAPGMINSGLFTPESLGFFASLKVIQIAGFGTFVFSTFAGLWLGVMVMGQAADRFGRKSVFTWSLMWYVVCTAIMSFQKSGQWLNIWRLVAGIGFGIQLVTIDAYIVELMPPTLRGRAFSINQFICFCSVPVVALLAWRLVPLKPYGFDGWRWLVLFGTVGAIVVWALRTGIPESPRWYLILAGLACMAVSITAFALASEPLLLIVIGIVDYAGHQRDVVRLPRISGGALSNANPVPGRRFRARLNVMQRGRAA